MTAWELRRAWPVLGAAVAGAFLVACGGGDGTDPSSTPSELGAGTGVTVAFQGHNLVLPQWGGIDSATLTVNDAGSSAFGELDRTGDGRYEVVYLDGETFFRRTTCDHFARIPGGGPDVLRPFLSLPTEVLDAANASNPAPTILQAVELAGFGTVSAEIDQYGRLLQVTGSSEAGNEFAISFSWGVGAAVSKPEGVTGDQGPGGNPC